MKTQCSQKFKKNGMACELYLRKTIVREKKKSLLLWWEWPDKGQEYIAGEISCIHQMTRGHQMNKVMPVDIRQGVVNVRWGGGGRRTPYKIIPSIGITLSCKYINWTVSPYTWSLQRFPSEVEGTPPCSSGLGAATPALESPTRKVSPLPNHPLLTRPGPPVTSQFECHFLSSFLTPQITWGALAMIHSTWHSL